MNKRISNFILPKFPKGTKRRILLDLIYYMLYYKIVFFQNESELIENHPLSTLPLDIQYKIWLKNNAIYKSDISEMKNNCKNFLYTPKISIIVPVYNVKKEWLVAAINSVISQPYENWELCLVDDASTQTNIKKILSNFKKLDDRIKIKFLQKNKGISGASNEAINLTTGDYVSFLDNDDILYPNALYEVVSTINQIPDVEIIYSDEDKLDLRGNRIEPHFKPDWSPELLLSGNYITHFCIIKKSILNTIGGFRLGYEGSQDYDLFLRATDYTKKIIHIPKILYGWRQIPGSAALDVNAKPYAYVAAIKALDDTLRRRKLTGTITQDNETHAYRIRYDLESPLISLIIPSYDDTDSLKKCINDIQEKTSYKNFEIIIVNHGNNIKSHEFFNPLNHKVVQYEGDFNLSKLLNIGASNSSGSYLIFLNANTRIITNDWIESMLEACWLNDVAISGSLLLEKKYGGDLIQHAGIILGLNGIASNAFNSKFWKNIYHNSQKSIRNCSAVSANCMMVKKSIFDSLGGWDEHFLKMYNDVDLCLRAKKLGYRTVFTPYAKFYQTGNNPQTPISSKSDENYFRKKWKYEFESDPYYNFNLSHTNGGYDISPYANLPKSLQILMEIFLESSDLKSKFPEAFDGNFKGILTWALCEGIKKHPQKKLLELYVDEFKKYLHKNNDSK